MPELNYLVRGALLQCDCGTHPRRLNLPACHGFYTQEHPVIQEEDCKVEININYFGICTAATPPAEAEQVILEAFTPPGGTKGPDIQGSKCSPTILGTWRGTKKDTILGNESAAVTTDSFLICQNGGIISPLTSGQEYEDEE